MTFRRTVCSCVILLAWLSLPVPAQAECVTLSGKDAAKDLAISRGLVEAQTLPELARAHGPAPIGKTLIRSVPAKQSLEDLAQESTLIVEGTVTLARSYLSRDQNAIYTDYRVSPSKTHFGKDLRAQPSLDSTVILTVYGGTMTLEGVEVTIRDSYLGPLPENEPLLLLLREGDAPGTFKLAGDVAGAFSLQGGTAKTLMRQSRYATVEALTYDQMIARITKVTRAK